MAKFKIGDKVVVNHPIYSDWNGVGEITNKFGITLHVKMISGLRMGDGGSFCDEHLSHLETYHTHEKCKCLYTEDAKRILEAQGYTITPPKEPETGKIYIYESSIGGDLWYKKQSTTNSQYKLLAIVDWTEGEGL